MEEYKLLCPNEKIKVERRVKIAWLVSDLEQWKWIESFFKLESSALAFD